MHFIFFKLNFTVLFPYLIKWFHILFIINIIIIIIIIIIVVVVVVFWAYMDLEKSYDTIDRHGM